MAEAADQVEGKDSVRGSKKKWKSVTVGPRQFKIRGPLGKGGFSEVYAGEDSETGKRVALKMMFDVQNDESTYKQTCDEIKMMRKLTHENLIKLLGYDLHASYRDRQCVILVQELAPNRELFEYLLHSKTTFSEQLVMYIGHQIFSAITFMHEKGIAHRDLKPENILLDKEFKLKIADFGFAKVFKKNDQQIKMRTELGTRGYMAPEISAGSHIPRANRQSYNEKVDIFALGVIMFICFAGFPPFRQTNNEDWWFDKIIKKEWPYFWKAHERKAKFSKTSKTLLQKMLANKAEDRYTIQQCMKSDFIANNPCGKMMDKTAYVQEMKKRYKYVKDRIKLAKSNKDKMGVNRDLKGALKDPKIVEMLKQYDDSFIPVEVLCRNDIRTAVYSAPNEDAILDQCVNQILRCQLEQFEDEPDAKVQHAMASDLRKVLSGYDRDELRATLSNASEPEHIAFLQGEGVNVAAVWKAMNKCIIGDDVAVPMEAEEGEYSLAFYQHFDEGEDLEMFDPEDFEGNPNAFHVKFGVGTFVHLIRQLWASHTKGEPEKIEAEDSVKTISLSNIEFDFSRGSAIVTYDIQEVGKLGEDDYVQNDELPIEVKLWQLLPRYEVVGEIEVEGKKEKKYKAVEVPGFALTVREARKDESLNLSMQDAEYLFNKLLHDSELTELCHAKKGELEADK